MLRCLKSDANSEERNAALEICNTLRLLPVLRTQLPQLPRESLITCAQLGVALPSDFLVDGTFALVTPRHHTSNAQRRCPTA